MAQQHLDRLTSTDAWFLHQEGPASHMHIGGVLLFEGPPPAFDDFLDHVRGAPAPRSRATARSSRRPVAGPAGRCGSTTRTSTSSTTSAMRRCRRPGSEAQLLRARAPDRLPAARPHQAAVGELAGRGDRAGRTPNERFALISKTHHALVDGVSGVDLATVLLDFSNPTPRRHGGARAVAAAARSRPQLELLARQARGSGQHRAPG